MSHENLTLYTQFSGFRLLVLANSLSCNNDVARTAHDRLAKKLGELAVLMREALAAERRFLVNADPAKVDELGEDVWALTRSYVEYWCEGDPIPLLDYICIDWGTREYFNPRSQNWYFLADGLPAMCDVEDDELCGLRSIINQIGNETGIRFSAYRHFLHDPDPAAEARGNRDGADIDRFIDGPEDAAAWVGPDTQ